MYNNILLSILTPGYSINPQCTALTPNHSEISATRKDLQEKLSCQEKAMINFSLYDNRILGIIISNTSMNKTYFGHAI